MSHGRNKYQSREDRRRVRQLLWLEWDPIGVNQASEATDEYDRYADAAYVMLMDQRANAEAIAEYLYWVAAVHMGLGESEERAEAAGMIAEKLVALRPEFETH
jgi:hypothetical protein